MKIAPIPNNTNLYLFYHLAVEFSMVGIGYFIFCKL